LTELKKLPKYVIVLKDIKRSTVYDPIAISAGGFSCSLLIDPETYKLTF
jgi:hypothetical protein